MLTDPFLFTTLFIVLLGSIGMVARLIPVPAHLYAQKKIATFTIEMVVSSGFFFTGLLRGHYTDLSWLVFLVLFFLTITYFKCRKFLSESKTSRGVGVK